MKVWKRWKVGFNLVGILLYEYESGKEEGVKISKMMCYEI